MLKGAVASLSCIQHKIKGNQTKTTKTQNKYYLREHTNMTTEAIVMCPQVPQGEYLTPTVDAKFQYHTKATVLSWIHVHASLWYHLPILMQN
jgi:hypothetical protein